MTTAPPPTAIIPEGNTWCLFICGATEPEDLWMFVDFMGSSKVFLNTGGIRGTYFNCWPIEEHLKKHSRVTWGYQGANDSSDPVIIFNRGDTAWWKDIPKQKRKDLPKAILKELKQLGQKAKFPDKVNIFIFSHGSEDGWLQIGSEKLQMSDLSKTVARSFEVGVQVNVIVAACYSGMLLDMIKIEDNSKRVVQVSARAAEKSWSFARQSTSGNYRGSPFVTAYMKSFMLGYEEAQTQDPSRTLQEHFNHVNCAGISHGIDDEGVVRYGDPQSHVDQFQNPLDAVLNIFTRRYVVHTMQGGTNQKKVGQTFYTPPQPGPQSSSRTAAASASVVPERKPTWTRAVQHEFDLLRTTATMCPNSDKGFFSQMKYLENSGNDQRTLDLFQELLLGLRWRFQLQERYMLIVNELLRDGLLDEDAILQPINFSEQNELVDAVVRVLRAFDNGAVCGILAAFYEELSGKLGHGNFNMPVRWLAILILRSKPTLNLPQIVRRFAETECFGKLHEEWVKGGKAATLRDMPNVCVANNWQETLPYEVGFFLPHVKTEEELKKWAEQTETRYVHIMKMFEQMMGEGSWGSADEFLDLLNNYKKYSLTEYLGPRWQQYLERDDDEELSSPATVASSSVFSASTAPSSATTVSRPTMEFAAPTSKKRNE
jgi:hypothetical protein